MTEVDRATKQLLERRGDEIAQLKETLLQYKAQLDSLLDVESTGNWTFYHLRKGHRRWIQLLLLRNGRPVTAIHALEYGVFTVDDANYKPDSLRALLSNYNCTLRANFPCLRRLIQTVHGQGYRIATEDRDAVRKLFGLTIDIGEQT